MDLIRASALQGFPELVSELGGDPDELLAAVRLSRAAVADTDAYISYRAVAHIVEHAASRLACPDFGLRLSTRQGVEIFGPIALIARHSATVGEALDGIAKHLRVYSPAIAIAVENLTEREQRLTFSILVPGLAVVAQANELSLGVAVRVFQIMAGSRFRPLRVAFPHTSISAPARYREFFGSAVTFEEDHCGFDFPSLVLEQPLARPDADVRDLAIRYLTSRGEAPPETLAEQVRRLIARALPTGNCSIGLVGGHLGVHPRTLQRKLREDGTSFAQLLDEVRRERAEHYLAESDLPMGQLALMLGYGEQSAFSRSCVRWFGASPRRVRGSNRPARALAEHM